MRALIWICLFPSRDQCNILKFAIFAFVLFLVRKLLSCLILQGFCILNTTVVKSSGLKTSFFDMFFVFCFGFVPANAFFFESRWHELLTSMLTSNIVHILVTRFYDMKRS